MVSSGWSKVEVPDSITFPRSHKSNSQRNYAFTKWSKDAVAKVFTDRQERKTERLIHLPIVGVDGEGYNSDTDHHYDLLAACTEEWTEYIEEFPELTADQIFDFLLSLPEKHGKALFVIFSSTYDFTMWVKRLPKFNQEQLIRIGKTRWQKYRIRWRQKREILIYDTTSIVRTVKIGPNNTRQVKKKYTRSIHLYDVFGFFQRSFVKTLAKWNTCPSEMIDAISAMKLGRGTFTPAEKEEVRQYCFEECRLLSKLMLQFRDACIEADITPQHWYGAGALATSLMRHFKVKDYLGEPLSFDQLQYMGTAYFGGRTEVSYQGRLPPGCVQYDINSAYPTAMLNLPDLIHGKWQYLDSGEFFDKYPYGVWHVEWKTHGNLFGPFPWRNQKGEIYYPDYGEGIYHTIEIQAAAKLFGEECFLISDGWVWEPASDNCKPFEFIIERAKYRLELKACKNPANEPLKLGLNSLYGKTAQTVGKRPPYQNFYWAGYTTAATRAKILDCIRWCKGTVYSIATDGLIVSEPIAELKIGPNLGEWEQTNIAEGILIKPGVYKWADESGGWHYGTRGFTTDEADWEEIERLWDARRITNPWTYSATRFIGLKQAYLRGSNWREYIGKWITEERELKFTQIKDKRMARMVSGDRSQHRYLMGTEEYRAKQKLFPGVAESPFIRLDLICWCKTNRKLSAMYRRLSVEDKKEEERNDIDDNQP